MVRFTSVLSLVNTLIVGWMAVLGVQSLTSGYIPFSMIIQTTGIMFAISGMALVITCFYGYRNGFDDKPFM